MCLGLKKYPLFLFTKHASLGQCRYNHYAIKIVIFVRLRIAADALCLDARRSDAVTLYEDITHAVGAAYGKHQVGALLAGCFVGIAVKTDACRRVLLEIFDDVLKHYFLLLLGLGGSASEADRGETERFLFLRNRLLYYAVLEDGTLHYPLLHVHRVDHGFTTELMAALLLGARL